MNYKKLGLLIGFIIFTVLLGYGVYFVFFVWSPETEAPGVDQLGEGPGQLPGLGGGFNAPLLTNGGTLPFGANRLGGTLPGGDGEEGTPQIDDVARGGLTMTRLITADTVESPQILPGGTGYVYYDSDDGKFYRISPDGLRKTLLSEDTFFAAEEITWAPDQTKAVIEFPDGANIIYDFSKQKATTLPLGAQDPSFSPDSSQLAYEYIGGSDEDNWLTVSNTDGSEAEFVQALGDKADLIQVEWSPSRQIVAMYRKAAGLSEEEIIFLGQNQENFKSLVVRGTKFEGMWTPQGDKIVYSVVTSDSGYNPTLWVADASIDTIGRNHFPLGVSTWTDKCVFTEDGATLYCAQPDELPAGAGLDRSIVSNGVYDTIISIDMSSGLRQVIAEPVSESGIGMQVERLFFDDGDLVLLDANSRSLVRVDLP